ncbi:MAG TPA: LemA family protein [Gammaproteobacteria bacterium]|nr:LemA family protein [Gammaproteobacteria bacterium]HIK69113.1 LemA family protein [Pseudomonadales bacterium]
MSRLVYVMLLIILGLTSGCGLNSLPTLDEQVKSSWSQVENQYQRRADLIPNLVATVKGYAAQEKDTLLAVTQARAKVGSMQVDPGLINDPAKLQQFEQAQSQLSGALSRLMVVVEKYPDLKSNQNFLALQSQLEGTENRISVARRDYIGAIERYNTEMRTYPGKLWHSWLYSELKPRDAYYEATAERAEQAPVVNF